MDAIWLSHQVYDLARRRDKRVLGCQEGASRRAISRFGAVIR
jgi:hypothetical protein